MADHAHNLRATFAAQHGQPHSSAPIGVITRGTTGYNRLRRADRWVVQQPSIAAALRRAPQALAIDVGYGASHTTTCEWARWLRRVRPDIAVLGLEIDPARVLPPREGVQFALGGFELAGHRPQLVRAFNVLRQYDVEQVPLAWETVMKRLAPGGHFIEGTCDELGRRATWVHLTQDGPQTLTLAWDPFDLTMPSEIAERLPKALIHQNTPGHAIYELLQAADDAWQRAAGFAPFGPRIRWREAQRMMLAAGVPLAPQRRKIRDNVLTIPWSYVD